MKVAQVVAHGDGEGVCKVGSEGAKQLSCNDCGKLSALAKEGGESSIN